MANLRRSIPSLGALATFEAAARLGSFTLAAAELGVTQAAVSRQVKALESDLGTRLFLRAHRRVTLTAAGSVLSATLSTSFERIATAVETLRQPHLADTVSLGATLAVSHFWLLPRLPGFRATFPDIRLRVVAEDGLTDMRRDRLDISIRYGRAPFPDGRSVASLRDTVFPVAAPALLDRHGMTPEDADPSRLPLIAMDWIDPTWMTWRTWARMTGEPALARASDRSGLRFNHYTDTIHAALGGAGVALGWAAMIAGHLGDGRLVRLGSRAIEPEERYHLLLPPGREPSPAALVLADWIGSRFLDP